MQWAVLSPTAGRGSGSQHYCVHLVHFLSPGCLCVTSLTPGKLGASRLVLARTLFGATSLFCQDLIAD